MFFDPEKIDNMVLVTEKAHQQGDTAPIGTIYYTNDGEPRSIQPDAPSYALIKTWYTSWKQKQTDRARQQRDREQRALLLARLGESPQRRPQLVLDLPGTPPAQASMDDPSIPLLSLYQAEVQAGDVTARVSLEPYSHRYGCYTLQGFYDKTQPAGALGRRQVERGKQLRDRLIALFTARLQEAGWRSAYDEPGKWRWEGQTIVEQEQQLAHLAIKTWRGRAQREHNEKIIELADDSPLLHVIRPKEWHQVPQHESLEYLIDPESLLLRVRRRPLLPTTEEQQRVATKRTLDVIGDSAARERGVAPAYHRTIETRPVTFTCRGCKQTVTQERLPGPLPRYCSDTCHHEVQRQKTLERVRRLREQRSKHRQVATHSTES